MGNNDFLLVLLLSASPALLYVTSRGSECGPPGSCGTTRTTIRTSLSRHEGNFTIHLTGRVTTKTFVCRLCYVGMEWKLDDKVLGSFVPFKQKTSRCRRFPFHLIN